MSQSEWVTAFLAKKDFEKEDFLRDSLANNAIGLAEVKYLEEHFPTTHYQLLVQVRDERMKAFYLWRLNHADGA
jgi:hypothetical protein